MNTGDNSFPTPHHDINLVLQNLLDKARSILGNYFVGMYLFGSLAMGGFNKNRSDIDFLIVTNGKLPISIISDLKNMHKELYESSLEWAKKLQGAYIPIEDTRVHSPSASACLLVDKDEFLVARPESNWVINRYILYRNGIVITGPPIRNFIDLVRPQQLKEAVLNLLRKNWTKLVSNNEFFLSKEGYQPFSVLSMCCFLYILKHGTVVPKQRMVEWVIAHSGSQWTTLINHAMSWNYGDPPGDSQQMQDFIKHVIQLACNMSH